MRKVQVIGKQSLKRVSESSGHHRPMLGCNSSGIFRLVLWQRKKSLWHSSRDSICSICYTFRQKHTSARYSHRGSHEKSALSEIIDKVTTCLLSRLSELPVGNHPTGAGLHQALACLNTTSRAPFS